MSPFVLGVKSQEEDQKIEMVEPEENPSSNYSTSLQGAAGVQLTEEEETVVGDVGWKPFWDYLFVSRGSLLLIFGIITQTGFVVFQAASTYWLALGIEIPKITSSILIGVYTAISIFSAVFVHLRSLFVARLGLRASKAFFSGFTDAIFKAPMLFFDSTPVGRILTRVSLLYHFLFFQLFLNYLCNKIIFRTNFIFFLKASSDLSILDYDIPFSILFVVAPVIELVAIIGIMSSVTWEVLIVALITIIASNYLQVNFHFD